MFGGIFRRKRKTADFSAEVQAHIQMEEERLREQGLTPEEAHNRAHRAFGNVTKTQERFYESAHWMWFDNLCQDVRFALRMLRKSPSFTAIAILTLALGIGANATIFSIFSAILLRKPPVKDPDTLCAITSADKSTGNDLVWVSAPDFLSWREESDVFDGMAAVESGRSFTLTGKSAPQSAEGDRITPGYFKIVGIAPLLGRTFLPSESQEGNSRVVLLSESLWRERYGSDPNILGEHVNINDAPHTIIGVMPEKASQPLPFYSPRLWMPLVFSADDLKSSARGNHYINLVVARLKPGISINHAQAEMNSIAERLATVYPKTNKHWGVAVLTLQENLIQQAQVRTGVMMMLTVVALVLLMACANIAGLLLARGNMRSHEIAVRFAIGAGRSRIVRQLLTESFILAAAGGAAGLILSVGGIRLLRAGFKFNVYGAQEARFIHLDQRTLLFTLGISALSAILFGLIPAFRASKIHLGDALSDTVRTGSGTAHSRLRNTLVAVEIALAIALLGGAGVMMREQVREFSQPLGFNPHHLVIANLRLDSSRYESAAARISLFERVSEKFKNLPGVESAALDNCVPLACNYETSFAIVGRPLLPDSKKPSAGYSVIGPDYFRTMQIRLLKGREFAVSDNSLSPAVAIVNLEFARRFFPNGDAIGNEIEATTLDAKPARIVGVIGNTSEWVGQLRPAPQIYECDLQFPFTAFSSTSILVRSSMATSAVVPMIRSAVWSVDNDQAVETQTMEDAFAVNVGGDKLMVALLGIFAALALVLATIGIYGLIAYSVSQRTREIGIRIALGAQSRDVLGLVLREGGKLTAIGCAAGALLAFPMPRIFSSLFVGFLIQGPLVGISVTLLVAIVALAACYIPARRAMKVDPMAALRYE